MKKISLLLVLTWVLFSLSSYAMNHDGMWNMGNWTWSGMMMNHENCDCPMMDKLTSEEKEKVKAMSHDEKMEYMLTKFGVDFMLENCKMMKSLTEEEKTKLKAMTKEELLTYMKDKRWTWAMMWKWDCMKDWKMWGMKNHMWMWSWTKMWNWMGMTWMMNSNNKAVMKAHESINKFFVKLDKTTDNAKKVDTLNKIIVKVDKLLADTTLSNTKKQVYTHIKHMLELKLEEIEATDVDLDWLLEINE